MPRPTHKKTEIMEISKRQLKRLAAFRGYGNPSSKLWFIGIEEKLPTDATCNSELRSRARFRRVMDLHDAQEKLRRDIKDAKTQTWTWMSKLARAILDGAKDWKNLQKATRYKTCLLGRSRRHMGETFLTELLPVPLSDCSQYPEPYDSRNAYEDDVWPQRKKLLKKMINKHRPIYVIAYSGRRKYQQKYREIFSGNEKSRLVLLPFLSRKFSHMDADQVIGQLKMEANMRRNELCDQEDIVEVISKYVKLFRSGSNWKGLCPFHVESTPSFTVSTRRQVFHCFGCGVGGGVKNFLTAIRSGSFSRDRMQAKMSSR